MSHRHPLWEQRLHALIEKRFNARHAYGRNDCLLLMADAVKALTGKDLGRGHRGKYKSAASASRYLRSLGHETPESYLDSLFAEKPIGFAQRGDIVLVPGNSVPGQPESWALPAICYGDVALAIGASEEREGLHRIPRALWLKAYAVGEMHADIPKPRKRRKGAG